MGENGDIVPLILKLGTKWRRVVSFMPWLLTLEERAPSAHSTKGWVGPRANLDTVGKKKNFLPQQGIRFLSYCL